MPFLVRNTAQTVGKDGRLLFQTGESVAVVSVAEASEVIEVDGGYRLPGMVNVDNTDVRGAFLFETTRSGFRLDSIVLVHGATEVPYKWSEEERTWVRGASRPTVEDGGEWHL